MIVSRSIHVAASGIISLEFSMDICAGLGLLDHMATLFLVFKGISILSSIVAAPIYILTNSIREFPFLHTLSSICNL